MMPAISQCPVVLSLPAERSRMRPKLATVPRERGSKTSTVRIFQRSPGKKSGQIEFRPGGKDVLESVGTGIFIGRSIGRLAATGTIENEKQSAHDGREDGRKRARSQVQEPRSDTIWRMARTAWRLLLGSRLFRR